MVRFAEQLEVLDPMQTLKKQQKTIRDLKQVSLGTSHGPQTANGCTHQPQITAMGKSVEHIMNGKVSSPPLGVSLPLT